MELVFVVVDEEDVDPLPKVELDELPDELPDDELSDEPLEDELESDLFVLSELFAEPFDVLERDSERESLR
ncbi:hypothetical protein [Prauserella cavernicola]|uniref:hypothetical protein n=1 Tax=Prauserella cavernicola TaxID=2800127 RepID=UPI0027DBEDD5|nr:hypothetical protein [Prauserella cavernicola]